MDSSAAATESPLWAPDRMRQDCLGGRDKPPSGPRMGMVVMPVMIPGIGWGNRQNGQREGDESHVNVSGSICGNGNLDGQF